MRAAILAVLLAAIGGPAAAQVSPGPLARAHRELEGALKCTKCHVGGQDAMAARCLACHRDIGWLAARSRGLHGSREAKAASCAQCHPDHAGADFQLIKWPEGSAERFDHRRAGWPLAQSHAKAACADCHRPDSRISPAAALAAKQPAQWAGLEPGCASCHADPHRGGLGAKCTECHDAGRWRITPGFDHDTTSYPLTGRHAEAECDACHSAARLSPKLAADGRPIPVYRPVPHQSCASCHRDPHAGRLGAGCGSCHSTDGFTRISPDRFDHSRTRYPLRGKHAAAPCAACHGDFSGAAKRPPFQTCATCHRTDPHAGTATLAGKPADCAACHGESGFKPATFTSARHRTARYPLEGKHATAPCAGCHRTDRSAAALARFGSAGVDLRPGFETCAGCHGDDHGGQLTRRPGRGECAECHTPAGWPALVYGAERHATLRLPLEGRHREVGCRACHGASRPGLPAIPAAGLGKAGFGFAIREVACADCHLDPHRGRFSAGGARPVSRGCVACHGSARFAPAAVDAANHAERTFPLRGAHRAVACVACHRELAAGSDGAARPKRTLIGFGAGTRTIELAAPTGCADCHHAAHGTQFETRPDRGRCDACHAEDGFSPATRFDHDRDAAFALGRGHARLACDACHKKDPARGGPAGTVFRPVPSRCEACHAGPKR